MLKRILRLIFKLTLVLVVLFILFIALVSSGFFGDLPTREQLANINNNTATELYSADQKLIGLFYIQERSSVAFEDISPNVINALIATEDARFYEHHGIDLRSVLRVVIRTVILQDRGGGGGSTISQQLIKNIFPREDHGIWTIPVIKVKESMLAYRLETIYEKDDILALYLNTVPFGDNVFGIETASQRFFNKSAAAISVEEAAVLVGMLKANYTYNPRIFPEKSLSRRNVVLKQMLKYGYLSEEEYSSSIAKPLVLDYELKREKSKAAAYFREQVRKELETWIKLNPKPDGSHYNLYTDGLRIHTTLDSRMQRYAERAMQQHMANLQRTFNKHWQGTQPWDANPEILQTALDRHDRYSKLKKQGFTKTQIHQQLSGVKNTSIYTWDGPKELKMSSLDSLKHYLKILHSGLVALDPATGDIKAWVGGIDFNYFKYDHVSVHTKRQVGSTFKPFVYAAALENGLNPCKHISAARTVYTNMKGWTPDNADREENVMRYSYKGALAKSVNTVTIKVMEEVGMTETIGMARKLGIDSEIPELPSIALGTPSISLLEMTKAYAAFANGGSTITPRMITKIEDPQGNVLAEFDATPPEKALNSSTAAMINEMLKEVVRTGTGSRIRWKYKINNDLAGKTGTTQSNADGWFIGYNPKLVVGVWVGADDPRVRFRTTNLGSGANTALPIFANFMKSINADPALKGASNARFPRLDPSLKAQMNCVDMKEDKGFFENLLGIEAKEKVREKNFGEKKKGFFKKLGDLFKKKENDN